MKPATQFEVDTVVSALEREGLVTRHGNDIEATEKGIDEANAIFQAMFKQEFANHKLKPVGSFERAYLEFVKIALPTFGGTVGVLCRHFHQLRKVQQKLP